MKYWSNDEQRKCGRTNLVKIFWVARAGTGKPDKCRVFRYVVVILGDNVCVNFIAP